MARIINITNFNERFFMGSCKMKNVVVLRNLPSNLIEEAFVVVKSRKVARSLEYIDGKHDKFKSDCDNNGYIVREAESVLSSYVSFIESKENNKEECMWKKKFRKLLFINIISCISFLVSIFIVFNL